MATGNTFFPKIEDSKFVIKNISERSLKIMNLKLDSGQSYDLITLPYVSEADIKHSLLKGNLQNKIRLGEIVITESNIHLVQYHTDFIRFMQGGGANIGVRDHALNERIITDLIDLPTPVDGVITLDQDNTMYRIRGNVDIAPNKILITADNTQIRGRNSQVDIISGSSDGYLVEITRASQIKDVGFTNPAGHGLFVDCLGAGVTQMSDVIFSGCKVAANICNINVLTARTIIIVACQNGIILEEINNVNINELLFLTNNIGNATGLTVPAGTGFNSFNIQNSFFFLASGQTGLNIDPGTTIVDRGIVKNCLFNGGGLGTPITGVTKKDPLWWFDGSTGVLDSRVIGSSGFSSDTPQTVVINSQNTWTVVDGTQILADVSERFELIDGYNLSYNGHFDYQANIIATASARVLSANSTTKLGIAINGIIDESSIVETTALLAYETFTLNSVAVLNRYDEVSLWVQNTESSSNFEFRTVRITIS